MVFRNLNQLVRHVLPVAALSLMLCAGGCAGSERYYERHHMNDLTIVFLDQESLRGKYALLTGKPAMTVHAAAAGTSVATVKGFYDFETKTLYCSKMDFEVCGHELHHAVIGHFHAD
jgi:hypothetical protein